MMENHALEHFWDPKNHEKTKIFVFPFFKYFDYTYPNYVPIAQNRLEIIFPMSIPTISSPKNVGVRFRSTLYGSGGYIRKVFVFHKVGTLGVGERKNDSSNCDFQDFICIFENLR